jgi:transposase
MPTGRPSKLTKDLIRRTNELVPKVVHMSTLAACLDVGERSVNRWAADGKRLEGRDDLDEDQLLRVEFWQTIKKGLSVAKNHLVEKIMATEAWQAWAWVLERRWPEEWGSQVQKINDLTRRINKLEKDAGGANPGTGATGRTGGTEAE